MEAGHRQLHTRPPPAGRVGTASSRSPPLGPFALERGQAPYLKLLSTTGESLQALSHLRLPALPQLRLPPDPSRSGLPADLPRRPRLITAQSVGGGPSPQA